MDKLIAVIRVRGKTEVRGTIERAIELLNLTRVNHCSFFKDSKVLRGMLMKGKDYLTWGNVNSETMFKVLQKRARLEGDARITDAWLKNKNITWEKLNELFLNNPKEVYKLGIKKVFRLTPPSKGHARKGIKISFCEGGALAERKEKINDLLLKMI